MYYSCKWKLWGGPYPSTHWVIRLPPSDLTCMNYFCLFFSLEKDFSKRPNYAQLIESAFLVAAEQRVVDMAAFISHTTTNNSHLHPLNVACVAHCQCNPLIWTANMRSAMYVWEHMWRDNVTQTASTFHVPTAINWAHHHGASGILVIRYVMLCSMPIIPFNQERKKE